MCKKDSSESSHNSGVEENPELEPKGSDGKKFERKIEDFTCDNCETFVQGDGYTDHCPTCLYSKHVDINPGDRNCDCCGPMKPMAAEVRKDDYKIHYECEKCGHEHKVKSSPNDNFDIIVKLVGKPY